MAQSVKGPIPDLSSGCELKSLIGLHLHMEPTLIIIIIIIGYNSYV